jgi:hypothetical protein
MPLEAFPKERPMTACSRASIPACRALVLLLAAGALLAPRVAGAIGAATAPYLLVGTGNADEDGTTVAVSNFELGQNNAAVPMPGLTLVEPIPADTLPVPTGVTNDGDVAITDPGGRFNLANLAIRGTLGVQCATTAEACNDGVSNTTFNGLSFPDQGLTGNVPFAGVLADLAASRSQIAALPGDDVLLFPGGDWNQARVDLGPGLTVFDLDTGGNDLLVQNETVVIDGPPGATAIFRVPDDANFLVSQSAIVIGDGGIAPGSVLFHSDRPDDDTHFSFSSAVVNGVAFWDLGDSGGETAFSNVQGCTQVIGDKLNLSDVRLTRCSFAVPEPGAVALGAAAVGALAGLARRRPARVARVAR